MVRDYKVYMHTNIVNGKRYIGITKNSLSRRFGNGNGYKSCRKLDRAIKKYGWDNFTHELLYEGLSIEEAERLEVDLIEKYDTINNGYNIDRGGNCCKGHSEETLALIREKTSGKNNGMYGKHHSEETLKKLRKPKSEEARRHISEGKKGKKSHVKGKTVLCVDTGEIYDSAHSCARALATNASNISRACREHAKSKGMMFEYITEVK